jgi:hypothetical protein
MTSLQIPNILSASYEAPTKEIFEYAIYVIVLTESRAVKAWGTTPHPGWERNPRTHVMWSKGLESQETLDHRTTRSSRSKRSKDLNLIDQESHT